MKLLKRALGLAVGISLASASYATYLLTRKGVRTNIDAAFFYTPFELDIPYENVTFHNNDGDRLRGWWLQGSNTNKVIVLCPGYGRSKSDLLGIGSQLWRAGYNVLMFDFRDQGESDPAIATIGGFETDDLHCALDYVFWRMPKAEIGLVGYSMGASTAIMVAAEREEVRAVIADSPFADLRNVLRKAFSDTLHVPPSPAFELAELLVWLRAGYRFSSVKPLEAVAQISPRPLLVIHGDADTVTPLAEGRALFDAAGDPKEFWFTPGCGHCGAYFADRQAYVDRVIAYFDRWLGKPGVSEQSGKAAGRVA